jgi:hypothetical protein
VATVAGGGEGVPRGEMGVARSKNHRRGSHAAPAVWDGGKGRVEGANSEDRKSTETRN